MRLIYISSIYVCKWVKYLREQQRMFTMIIGMEALALIIGIPLVYILARYMAGQYGWVAALRPYV